MPAAFALRHCAGLATQCRKRSLSTKTVDANGAECYFDFMATWAPSIEKLQPARRPEALTEVGALLERMVTAYSPATVAGILAVDKSAVSHWLNQKRAISPPMRSRIIEAHDVLSRVHQVFNSTLAARWLIGHEPLLGGARPIDVLGQRGATPVIDALDAIASGGYA